MGFVVNWTDGKQINLEGYTLIFPCVSVGNIGVLAVDALIYNFKLSRSGIIKTVHISPVVGNDPFSNDLNGDITTNFEIFCDQPNRICIIQQRAPIIQGHTKAFCDELADWIGSTKISTIVLASGLDGRFRNDYQMDGPQIRFKINDSLSQTKLANTVQSMAIPKLEETSENLIGQYSVPTLLNEKLNSSQQKPLILSLFRFCLQGDNKFQGMEMAAVISLVVGLFTGNDKVTLSLPQSWKYLEGISTKSDEIF
eukprot:c18990_g1_i1.p1 GENE.c18990_g1_i1~~c18990_g1_i1.p1  ORF type:complete len:254 (+),score=82.69 c18990_g1_i1:37-798(+)